MVRSSVMAGDVFGRLTIDSFLEVRGRKRFWSCRCLCGNIIETSTGQLRSGKTRSCGCLKIDNQTKHGMYGTRTYRIWQAMLNRCRQDQYSKYYSNIKVCESWTKFENFLNDMGEAPPEKSIDRIDNSLGYFADNCRWATQKEQTRNTRRRKEYQHNGQSMSLIEWAEYLGVSHELLRGRIRRGWSFSDAITKNG